MTILSSDEDEDVNDVDEKLNFNRLLKELQNSRQENREMNQQLTKLTNKMSHFGSMLKSVRIFLSND